MLKRHFTMIYSQLDELKEQMSRVESNIADLALRMQEINRKYAQIEGSRVQASQAEKTSQELTSAVEDLKRDINSLRARFESELLSLGDPINSRGSLGVATQAPPPSRPTPPAQVQPTIEAPAPQPQPEPEPPAPVETPHAEAQQVAPPAPSITPTEEAETSKEDTSRESSSDTKYEPSLKSLEEQLGLVPPSDQASNEQPEEKQAKPEEKKKRRFF